MKHMCSSIIILVVVLAIVKVSLGATYYVDVTNPSAADSNPGTEDLPWRTMNHAMKVASAGDTVLVKSGTYDCGDSGSWSIPALNPVNSGTAQKPILFKAYSSHTVTLIGNPKPIGANGRSYIVWDGFLLKAKDTSTDREGGIAIFDSSHIVIRNCEIIGHYVASTDNHDGIRIESSQYITIENCIIHGTRGESVNSAGIKLYYTSNVVVKNNEIYDCTTAIFDKDNGINNIYRYNILRDSDYGIYGPGNKTDAKFDMIQNIFKNISSLAVYLNFDSRNCLISNNVFFKCDRGVSSRALIGHQIFNNIFYQCGNPIWTKGTSIEYSNHNCFWNNGSFVVNYQPLSLQEWRSSTGFDQNSLHTDPLFKDFTADDFHLSPSSPCVKAGVDRGDYDVDGDKNEAIPMGCYIIGSEIIGTIDTSQDTPNQPIAPSNLRLVN